MKYFISWKVILEGGHVAIDRWDDPEEFDSIDGFVAALRRQYGSTCEIELHIWRENWGS